MNPIEFVLPGEIEKRSFEIISEELEKRQIVLPKEQEPVTKRVIHTSADFDYAETMCYSDHAVEIAKELILKGADIVTWHLPESIRKYWHHLAEKPIALWRIWM